MEFVQPIRDRKILEKVKKSLMAKSRRDYCLFVLGINSGLRISNLLPLKVEDIMEAGKIKDRLQLREQKTNKSKDFPLSKSVQKALKDYLAQSNLSGTLFPSRKGDNKPLTRQQAYRIINDAARAAGITDKIGTHTIRKTFAYHAIKGGNSIITVQKLLNHSSPGITLAYAGLTQDDMDAVYLSLDL